MSFLVRERENILNRVSERNLCARLGIYLHNVSEKSGLKGYFADPEYNRKQNGQVKTILDENLEVIVVNCDLILHSRGNYDGVWSYDGVTLPEHVCGYELGFYIELDHRKKSFLVEEYRAGEFVELFSGDL